MCGGDAKIGHDLANIPFTNRTPEGKGQITIYNSYTRIILTLPININKNKSNK